MRPDWEIDQVTGRPIDDPLGTAAQAAMRGSAMVRSGSALLRPATVVTLGLVVLALLPVSVVTSGPSFCPFKMMTGLPCPGCGMTRSVVTLLHGDIGASLYYHPLGIAIVALGVALAVADAWYWGRGAPSPLGRTPPTWLLDRLMLTPAPWVAIGALTVVWFVRLPLYVAGIWVF
jgi:hypothetical protein